VVAGLNFNYQMIKADSDPTKDLMYLGVLIHEVNHSLGFSSWFFSRFVYKGTYKIRPEKEIVQNIDGRTRIVTNKIK